MSVRKRSWTTRTGESKEAWIVDYADQQGNRHLKTFRQKKQADAYSLTVSVQVRDGVHVPDSTSITVKEAGERWIKTAELHGLERSTIGGYLEHLRLHILPYLGSIKLSQLSVSDLKAFETKLLDGIPPPGVEHAKARSADLVRKVRTSLGSIVAEAGMPHNVVRELSERSRRRDRRLQHVEERHRDEVEIPTADEIKAILEAARGRWRPFLLTAIYTGLRSSELRGLTWENVDFDKGELKVTKRADRYNVMGPPKSKAGRRTVPIPPRTLAVLREWKLACPKGPLGLVFPNGKGKIESHGNAITRGLIPTLLAAGVADVVKDADGNVVLKDGKPVMRPRYSGLHFLRHYFASWCIGRKVDGGRELPAKLVQTWLGHSSIKMTLDTYGHKMPRGDDAAELAEAEGRSWG